MKRYKIGYDAHNEEIYNGRLSTKQKLGADAVEYASQYVHIDDLSAFYDNMIEVFAELFKAQYKDVFDKRILTEIQYQNVGFHLEKLRSYQNAFQSIEIRLDAELKPLDKKDFSIYLTNEKHIQTYKNKERFLKALNEYVETGAEIKEAIFQKALPMQFNYDYRTNLLTPN